MSKRSFGLLVLLAVGLVGAFFVGRVSAPEENGVPAECQTAASVEQVMLQNWHDYDEANNEYLDSASGTQYQYDLEQEIEALNERFDRLREMANPALEECGIDRDVPRNVG